MLIDKSIVARRITTGRGCVRADIGFGGARVTLEH